MERLARKYSLKWPWNHGGTKARMWSFKLRWSNTLYYLANCKANKPHYSGENVIANRLQFLHRVHTSYEALEYMWSVEFSAFSFYCLKVSWFQRKSMGDVCGGKDRSQVAWMLPLRNIIPEKRASGYEVDGVNVFCTGWAPWWGWPCYTRSLSVWHSSPSMLQFCSLKCGHFDQKETEQASLDIL